MKKLLKNLYFRETAYSVKEEFIDLLKSGFDEFDATNKMMNDNLELLDDDEDGPIFWLVLLDTQWNLGRLTPIVKEKALDLIKKQFKKEYYPSSIDGDIEERKAVLKLLDEKLKIETPIKKKITQYKYFRTSWKHRDTFICKISTEYSKKLDLHGRYIVFYTLYQEFWCKGVHGDYFPVVYLKITKDKSEPKTLDDINNCHFIRIFKFTKGPEFVYKTTYLSKSKASMKKLKYIGKFDIYYPRDEKKCQIEDYSYTKVDFYDEYNGDRHVIGNSFKLSNNEINNLLDSFVKFNIE
ncbi:hypothetical protein ACAG96_01965 [Candidatus Izemoplasma sp. B36]|uniref:hypothetical protein n=1 Tax=Candidatus Izemoplasma sp. B36 TaxID=3242468 RepID=UPI0035588503